MSKEYRIVGSKDHSHFTQLVIRHERATVNEYDNQRKVEDVKSSN